MSTPKRVRFLELINKYGVPVLEDDPYSELCYEGQTMTPLKSMDKSGYVIYLSTFSKTVYPGLWLLPVVQAAGGPVGRFARHPGGAKRRGSPSGNSLLSAGTERGELYPAELHLPFQEQDYGGNQMFMPGYQKADGTGKRGRGIFRQ